MNRIIYPMKVHAVKLEYKRLELENMPHGYFLTCNGREYVVITYDPGRPVITNRSRRRLLTSTRRGKEYTERINTYLISYITGMKIDPMKGNKISEQWSDYPFFDNIYKRIGILWNKIKNYNNKKKKE